MGLWFVMSWGMAGIGTAVMHDANHGTYSPQKRVNQFIGHILEIIGGYTVTWKIQHNVLHHTYTNIAGLDEDIDSIILLRLSPRQKRYWFHRYQYLYAWFFYMMMTLFWMTVKDYLQVVRYKHHDLLIKQKVSLRQAVLRITGGSRHMEDSWAIHELANTTDFAPRSHLLSWFIGGLNYQIEHHLFTGVCHVHYKKIAPIVRATASDFGLPYHVQPTFLQALMAHARMLKMLGKA